MPLNVCIDIHEVEARFPFSSEFAFVSRALPGTSLSR